MVRVPRKHPTKAADKRSNGKKYWRHLLALTCWYSLPSVAQLDAAFEVGVGYTDNLTRTPDTLISPALEDTIYSAQVELGYFHQSARSEVDLQARVAHLVYVDTEFGSDTLPALDLTGRFRITDQVLSWFLLGNVGQQSVNPFQPIEPENRENFGYVTTGPSLVFPLDNRFYLTTDAYVSEVRYEQQPLDNQRLGGQLGLTRQMTPNRSLSLLFWGERTEFDFDPDTIPPPSERYDVYFQFDAEGANNAIVVDLGWNTAERAGMEFAEPLVNVEWIHNFSPSVEFAITGGTRISDAAQSFRGSQGESIDFGAAQTQQPTGDPFREDYVRMRLGRVATRTDIAISIGWNDEDFETQSQFNRGASSAIFNLVRRFGDRWEIQLLGRYVHRDYTGAGTEDTDRGAELGITWHVSRTFEIELRGEYYERESTIDEYNFEENRAYLNFRYVPDFGSRQRPASRGTRR